MASPRQWCSRGALVLFSIAAILCIAFCFNIICKPSNQKNGIITFLFDFLSINLRSVSLSIPTNPDAIPGAVSIISSQAQSVESVAATAVSSAGAAVETATDSILPKNCSLGTKYFCVGFTDHIDCKDLPLRISNIIPSSVTTVGQFSNLETVDRALAEVNSKSINGCFIMGLTFAVLAILPDVILICSILANQQGLILFWISKILVPLRVVCSSLCCVSILAPTIILYSLLSKAKDLPEGIAVEIGEASKQVLAAFTCAIFMGISIIVKSFLDRL